MTSVASAYDLTKERPAFYKASRKPELIDLPEAQYLVADGSGSPDAPLFIETVASLFNVAYTLKFASKKAGRDFKVMTFEGSWSIEGEHGPLERDAWQWQLCLMVPDFITEADVEAARTSVSSRKGPAHTIRLERITRGRCVQIMHLGPYDGEDASLAKMHAFIAAQGLRRHGPHHEVYIGNPQRSRPETLKTILRLEVEPES